MKKLLANLSVVLFAVMSLSLTLMAAGCSGKKSGSTGEDGELNKAQRLVIGHNPNYFPIIVAYEKGFFKDEFGDELKIEIPLFTNGPAQNEALKAGQLDIANMGDLPTIQLWANGTDIQVISYLWDAPDGLSLVANKRSGIKTLADLKGKKIAVQFGSNYHKLALRFLAAQGLDADDAELVNLQISEAIVALKQGIVDATALIEPTLSRTLNEDSNIVEISTSRGYDKLFILAFVRTEYAKQNPQIVSRYLKAIKRTNDWIAQNADEAIRIVLKFMGSNDYAGTKKYLDGRTWPVAADQELIDRLNATIKFCRDQELITRDDLDAKNLVTDKYVKAAGL
jgi:sulfonate transport system substrate-binding protein